MSQAQVQSLLTEGKARFVSYKDAPLLFQRELVRAWPAEPDKLLEENIRYLNGLTPRSVVDPQADGRTFAGTWRRVSVDRYTFSNEAQINAPSGIAETLRYGFGETLDWTEARFIRVNMSEGNTSDVPTIADTQSDDPEHYLLVEFTNLNPATAPGLAANTAATYTDVVVRGVTYSGLWHKIAATVLESELERDGSVRIQLLLARPQYTLQAYESYVTLFTGALRGALAYHLWNVPKDIAQTIITSFQSRGRSATPSYSSDNMVNLVLTEDYMDPYGLYTDTLAVGGVCAWTSTQQFYWEVHNPTLSMYDPTTFADYRTSGVSYRRSIEFNRERGTFDIVIYRTETQTRRYTPYVSTATDLMYEDTYLELGVRDGLYFTIPEFPELTGIIYSQTASPNEDCSSDIRTMYQISKPDEFYFSWLSDGLANGMWVFENRRAVPDDIVSTLDGTNNNSADIRFNQDKTYSGIIRTSPQWGTIQGYQDFYYITVTTDTMEEASEGGSSTEGQPTFKKDHYTLAWANVHYVSYHASEAAAYQSSQTTPASIGSPSVGRHGAVWRCERIVHQYFLEKTAGICGLYLDTFDLPKPTWATMQSQFESPVS